MGLPLRTVVSLSRSFGTGRCLNVPGASISPRGRGVPRAWDCNGGAQQQWVMDGTQLRVYADMCLDAVGGGTASGTQIQVWPCNGDAQQQWTWGADGTIRSIPGGRCLDVVGGDLANGTRLQLWDCSGANWRRSGSRPLRRMEVPPIVEFGKRQMYDVIAGDTSPGARVQMFDCLGDAEQQSIQGRPAAVFRQRVPDAVGGGTANGTPVQVWPCNGDAQQQWTWGADGTIRSISSGRCLDVVGGSNANGASLQLFDCLGAAWAEFARPPQSAKWERPVPLTAGRPPRPVDIALRPV